MDIKYIVIEIQEISDESVGVLTNTYTDYWTAQQKYHMILAAAAVSALPVHSAAILDQFGVLLERQSFSRPVEDAGGGNE